MSTLAKALGLDTDPRPLQLLGEAGYLWLYMGRLTEAADVFDALARLAPKDPAGHLGLAEVKLAKNECRPAQQSADKAYKAAMDRTDGKDGDRMTAAMARLVAGRALTQAEQPAAAKQAFDDAVQLDPKGTVGQTARGLIDAGVKLGLFDPPT